MFTPVCRMLAYCLSSAAFEFTLLPLDTLLPF